MVGINLETGTSRLPKFNRNSAWDSPFLAGAAHQHEPRTTIQEGAAGVHPAAIRDAQHATRSEM